MFYRTIYVCLFGFALALFDEEHSPEITFEIKSTRDNRIVCDHTMDEINTYTVREGEKFILITKFNYFINELICGNHMFSYNKYTKNGNLTEITFNVDKDMGNIWNCTILAHRNNLIFRPMVQYKNVTYAAVSCLMKIHVRQRNSPQTILVNNMVLETLRTDLSIKDVDFTAEYQYADGDVVHLTCANFSNPTLYTMTGTMRDISTIKDLLAQYSIGFRAKLGAGQHNTYIICNNTGPTDYTKVMVRFVMRTEFNFVTIQINGMTLRPKLTNVLNNHYEIEYKYQKKQSITLVCEVRTDLKLVVTERNDGFVKSYQRTDLIPNKKTEVIVTLKSAADAKIDCATDYPNGTSAEQVAIHFTAENYQIDQYLLRMNFLPSNGTVMELYGDYKLKVFFYEFEDGETLQLNCGPLNLNAGPVLYIQFGDPVSDICKTTGCKVPKTLHLTRKDENKKIVCYLKEDNLNEEAEVLREIRVIFRERVVTTTSTTTTTTTTRSIEQTSTNSTLSGASSKSEAKDEPASQQGMQLAVIAIVILCIIIICVTIVIVKLRKRNHSQRGPHNRNYENLQSPSEASIPAYPTQWESNYAVPVDRRTEDTTYSVPCQEPVLYSTPTPKNLRNKKQKPVEPTYAVLDVPCGKNTFKETEDPNYSEVYARRQEQCYAKVMPKSERKKMPKDDHPYANVSNEPAYVNTAEPEPMYCEPGKAQGRTYANLNNSHYANHVQDQSYVEPTYCEPQTRMK